MKPLHRAATSVALVSLVAVGCETPPARVELAMNVERHGAQVRIRRNDGSTRRRNSGV